MDVNVLIEMVFSGLSALVVEDVTDDGGKVVVTARTRDVAVPCPACRTPVARVHGYHRRTVRDVPVDGRPVAVHLRVRRLVCPVLGCSRQTFREQIPGLIVREHYGNGGGHHTRFTQYFNKRFFTAADCKDQAYNALTMENETYNAAR